MNDCKRISDLLTDYINRKLTQEQNGEIAGHLAACHRCRREMADLIKIKKVERDRMADVPREIMDTAFLLVSESDRAFNDIISLNPYRIIFDLVSYSLNVVNQAIQLAHQAI